MDKNIEEARTFREIERLEKRDTHFFRVTIFMVLVLTLFILIKDFNALNFSPREYFNHLTSLKFSALVLPAAVLILIFCGYVLFQNRKVRLLRREVLVHKIKLERMIGTMEEVMAFLEITSGISNHKDINAILDLITRNSLKVLKAHRSTVLLLEGKSGILKAQCAHATNPADEQVGLYEEKEIARRAIKQKKPFLLFTPEDFANFFKYEGRDRKITSLMSIPIFSQGKAVGALSVALINDERSFSEKNLQFLTIFGNHASIALENAYLAEEVQKGIGFRKSYERYLDDILNQLQNLSDEERHRIEEHIGRLMPTGPPLPKGTAEEPEEEDAPEMIGKISVAKELGIDQGKEEQKDGLVRVEFGEDSIGFADELGTGGLFIRTPNPLDLGEQFVLKLHIADGKGAIELPCKVVWTNKYGKESRHLRRGMGIKFLNLSPEVQKRVEEYIKSQRSKGFSFGADGASFMD